MSIRDRIRVSGYRPPRGLIFQLNKSVVAAAACRQWIRDCEAKGVRLIVPSIADYEVRRELTRLNLVKRIAALDAFNEAEPDRYLPLADSGLRLGAKLWAQSRQAGNPTADARELDCDVSIASQVLDCGFSETNFVIATTNVRHLSLFVPAALWYDIIL